MPKIVCAWSGCEYNTCNIKVNGRMLGYCTYEGEITLINGEDYDSDLCDDCKEGSITLACVNFIGKDK